MVFGRMLQGGFLGPSFTVALFAKQGEREVEISAISCHSLSTLSLISTVAALGQAPM